MSTKATDWAWVQNIKPGPKIVLLCLAKHANKEGICWPAQKTIAEECGFDRATVNQHLRWLVEAELIEIGKRSDEHGYRSSSLYILNLTKVDNSNVGISTKVGKTKVGISTKVGKTNVGKTKVGKSNVGKTKVGISDAKVGISDAKVGNPNSIEPNKELKKEVKEKEAAARPAQAQANPSIPSLRQDTPARQERPRQERDPIWHEGVEWLEGKGCKNVRAYLGGLCKDYGTDAVIQALEAARVENPVEPKGYLVGVLKGLQRRHNGQERDWYAGAI